LLKTDGLSVIQERMPAAASEVNHYHEHARQFFFILAGEATLEINGSRLVLGPSQGIDVPPKTPHQLLNLSNQELHFIVVSAPASHGDRVVVA
jgi:mannose-6-phosphate isomerase-like protein (cupin superfamily)